MNKRHASIPRKIQMKKSTPSLGCMSSLSVDTRGSRRNHINNYGMNAESNSKSAYSLLHNETKSITTRELLELMHDDDNACDCTLSLDDVSLASNHGLLDVKEENYWFHSEEDFSNHKRVYERRDDETSGGTKICHDHEKETTHRRKEELDVVYTAKCEDSDDSLINGFITIDLKPKMSEKSSSFVRETKLNCRNIDEDCTIETATPNANHDDEQLEGIVTKASISSETTTTKTDRSQKSLSISTPSINEDVLTTEAAKSTKSFGSEGFNGNREKIINGKNATNIIDSMLSATVNQPLPNHILPRQKLAHKFLHDALKIIQREDATNATLHTNVMSREQLHMLTNLGCAMMLKKKESKKKEHVCSETSKEIAEIYDHEHRNDLPTTYECDEEESNIERERDIVTSESIVESSSLISYIGTVTDNSICNSSSEPPIAAKVSDDPESNGLEYQQLNDSQHLQMESDSTTGLSYINTKILESAPCNNLTALISEDRTTIPLHNASLKNMKVQEENMHLMQVETTPTDDETVSVDVASMQSSTSVDSMASALEESSTLGAISTQDSIDEKNDTLSPLPPQSTEYAQSCHSPTSSHANSSTITSVSDVFGMLRTSLHDSKSIASISCSIEDMLTSSSSTEEHDKIRTTDVGMHESNLLKSTASNEYQNKSKQNKCMTSMFLHDNDRCGMTLRNALMATEIFTPTGSKNEIIGATSSPIGSTTREGLEQTKLNYSSIDTVTFSPLRAQNPNRPQSVVFGRVTSPTSSMFSGYSDHQEGQIFLSMAESMVNDKKKIEMETEDSSLTDDQFADQVESKVDEYKYVTRSDITDHIGNNEDNSTVSTDSNSIDLYKQVSWLEKILGVERGGRNREYKNEVRSWSQKDSAIEQKLQEEIELKAVANKTTQSRKDKFVGTNEDQEHVGKCLRNEVSSLKAQLIFEKIKSETAESDVKAALSSVLNLGIVCKKKDEEIAELTRANKMLSKRQGQLENDLMSRLQENDVLRSRILTLTNDCSTKERTLMLALAQLKSLSENVYHAHKQLEDEKKGKHNEVEALQFSLDDMSRQTLNISRKLHEVESENDSLRLKVRRLKMEKEQSQQMRRAARGF